MKYFECLSYSKIYPNPPHCFSMKTEGRTSRVTFIISYSLSTLSHLPLKDFKIYWNFLKMTSYLIGTFFCTIFRCQYNKEDEEFV